MSRNIEQIEKEEQIAQNIMTSVANLVHTWKEGLFIESVMTNKEERADPTTTNMCK